ncbi:sodium channel modifier 1-like isoform X2 [Acanthaster planci]|nr:sodium channel modifier 1-like isoform X2 [Acanthaster planci]
MSNGRYACTVCSHRPVLDTIAMLLVHRQGKKHQSYVRGYYAKKQDLMKEVEKRKQQLYLKQQEQRGISQEEIKDVAPLLTKTRKATHHALLKTAPYKGCSGLSRKQDSCSVRRETPDKTAGSFFQRVSQTSRQHDSTCSGPKLTSATCSDDLPGNRGPPSGNQSETAADSPSVHITKGQSDSTISIGHRNDAASYPTLEGSTEIMLHSQNAASVEEPLTVTEKRHPASFQLKPYVPKHQRHKALPVPQPITGSANKSGCEIRPSLTTKLGDTSTREPLQFKSSVAGSLMVLRDSGSLTCDVGTKRRDPIPSRDLSKRAERKVSKPTGESMKCRNPRDDTRRADREKYLKLTSSGWKTDWRGGWVQDQDVEFDSDEEVTAQ